VPVESRSMVFAAKVQPGDRILVRDESEMMDVKNEIDNQHRLRWDIVVDMKLILEEGVYAPLTMEGTLLVDDVVVSCYALVDSQSVAHYAFLPLRIWHSVTSFFLHRPVDNDARHFDARQQRLGNSTEDFRSAEGGVHWYATVLYSLSSYVLPSRMLYN